MHFTYYQHTYMCMFRKNHIHSLFGQTPIVEIQEGAGEKKIKYALFIEVI